MTPEAIKADYTQNGAAYSGSSTPMLGVTPSTYSYVPDAAGGYNFYQNGNTPITREQYSSLSGNPYPGGTGAGAVLGAAAAPTAPTADPYAQWGGQQKYDALRSGFDSQHQGITDTANEAVGSAGRGLNSSILDLLDSLRSGQRNIDSQGVQNELAKQQGTQGVLGMVGRGIRSGGVMLANKNASDSSASQALANAYGDLGRRQLSSVGSQYAQGQNAIQQAQTDLGDQQAQGTRHIQESKTNVVNGIVTGARNSLAALDAAIAGASLPDRINIEQEKEKIRNNAMTQLQRYDQQLAQGVGGIQAASADTNRASAAALANQGTAADNAFSYTDQAPAQLQNTGPFSSNLPLFQLSRSKKTG
jgi:hypothetical protein